MRLKIPAIILLTALLLGCVPEPESSGYDPNRMSPLDATSIDEYNRLIDFSCEKDLDCTIKDVGNCCGTYPRCVNSNAETYPGHVMSLCREMMSVCGYPSIASCECQGGFCVGVQ